MDNFEKHYKIQLLADDNSKYSLAKKIVEMEENLEHIGELSDGGEAQPQWYVSLETNNIDNFVDGKKVYIIDDE
jgi:hypothetical protein